MYYKLLIIVPDEPKSLSELLDSLYNEYIKEKKINADPCIKKIYFK